jgi:hypothetical protein
MAADRAPTIPAFAGMTTAAMFDKHAIVPRLGRMRNTLLVASLLAAATAAHAQAQDALKPMAFLAGHCWKGELGAKGQTDEHCFAWMYGGHALRDTHVVRPPGMPDYVGESTYYYDSERKRVEYVYIENMGGISRGTMEPAADALVFPPTKYVNGGQALTYRVRWTPVDARSYEAFSETQGADGNWSTQFRVVLKRVD